MNTLKNQRGQINLGTLLVTILLLASLYAAYRTIPVYMDKIYFEEDLGRITSKAGVDNWSDRQISLQIRELAVLRQFAIGREDIEIVRATPFQDAPRLKIKVSFSRTVDYPAYSYTFSFDSENSTFIGRL